MRVIFLDVDGPLIPGRQYKTREGTHRYSRTGGLIGYRFDAFCVRIVSDLARTAAARIVWNTTHNARGLNQLMDDAQASGFDLSLFHETHPQTEYPGEQTFSGLFRGKSRLQSIRGWLSAHPEVTDWIVIDDERIRTPRLVHVSFDQGVTSKHYDRALDLLGVDAPRKVLALP